MKELKLRSAVADSEVVWTRHRANNTFMGQHTGVMDPHERKSVYVGSSLIEEAGEGIFANKIFSPGDLVSYYSGQKTYM